MIDNLTYGLESVPLFWKDSEALRAEHESESKHDNRMVRREAENIYRNLWLCGALQLLVARDGDKPVGYYLSTIQHHSHYLGTLVSYEDSKFLSKAYRRGLNGVKLVKEAEAFLREAGVQYHYTSVPEGDDRQGKLLEHLGFAPEYSVYGKWIGD